MRGATDLLPEQFAGKENENLQKWLGLKTAEVILKAAGDLKRAEIATGNFDAGQFTRNRLIGKLGTKNDDFSYIFLKQKEGKAGIIGSFSAHPTILGSENMEISAEYPGYWARKMKDSVDFAMFLAGSMGSQSPAGEATGFEKAKILANLSLTACLSNSAEQRQKKQYPLHWFLWKYHYPNFKSGSQQGATFPVL